MEGERHWTSKFVEKQADPEDSFRDETRQDTEDPVQSHRYPPFGLTTLVLPAQNPCHSCPSHGQFRESGSVAGGSL